MQRRAFIAGLGGTAMAWPLAARAQQPAGRVYRVGYLAGGSQQTQLYLIKAFDEGLRSLGYRVGHKTARPPKRLFHLVLEPHAGRALVPIPKRSASPWATSTPQRWIV